MRHPKLECGRCGYDLREHRDRQAICPECGWAISDTLRQHPAKQRRMRSVDTACVAGAVFVGIQILATVIVISQPTPNLFFFWFDVAPFVAAIYLLAASGLMVKRGVWSWAAFGGLLIWIATVQIVVSLLFVQMSP